MYSCLCAENGGVVDDIFVFMVAPGDYYVVVNAATTEKDLAWIRAHNNTGAEVLDVSDGTSKIDIQGPLAAGILQKVLPDSDIAGCTRFHFFYSTFEGARVMVSRTGYTGEDGFELFIENNAATELWHRLMEAGSPRGLKPAGLGARDTLRLEASYSLYGHELGDDITPVEGGLRWLVNSGDDFIGRDVLVRQKEQGSPRELVCFELKEKGVPREHCRVLKDGMDLGLSTSGGYSPTLKKGIGMALVKAGVLKTGDGFSIVLREREVPAVVVKRPFYSYHGA
jgi:aminomethyltransferase